MNKCRLLNEMEILDSITGSVHLCNSGEGCNCINMLPMLTGCTNIHLSAMFTVIPVM